MARHGRDARFGGKLLRADLVAHRFNGVGVRADKGNAFGLKPLGEFGVFRKEAEAGMDSLSAGFLHRVDDLVHHEIALAGRRGTDMHGLVGHLDCHGAGIGVGVDNHSLHAQPAAGLDDPNRDLAPVGDQDFFEHVPSRLSLLCIFVCLFGVGLSGARRLVQNTASRTRMNTTGGYFLAGIPPCICRALGR